MSSATRKPRSEEDPFERFEEGLAGGGGEVGRVARGCGGSALRRGRLRLMHCGDGRNQRAARPDEVMFMHRGEVHFVCWDAE